MSDFITCKGEKIIFDENDLERIQQKQLFLFCDRFKDCNEDDWNTLIQFVIKNNILQLGLSCILIF